jgi:hypothetical protein
MNGLRLFLPLVLVAAAPAGEERGPAGTYRLVGEQDVASGFQLWKDGRFEYFLSGGALDEQARGRWRVAGGALILTTEPKPAPPVFRAEPSSKTKAARLTVKVTEPGGAGIPGVDLRIGFDQGESINDYTQEGGWILPAEEKRVPRWIEFAVPMYGLSSSRFPIDLASGNALAFTLVPNDLGVVDFAEVKVEVSGNSLIVHRDGWRLRYQRAGK